MLSQNSWYQRLSSIASLQIKGAIKGFVLMSDELDSMFYDLLINKVPENWKKVSYPNLKPLGSWMKDLR